MRIFVTGATGYVGAPVAAALKACGHDVVGLARSESAAAKLIAAGVAPVQGDFSDPQSLAEAARSADAVVHAASTMDHRMAMLDAPTVAAMLGALENTGKPFLYTSGTFVVGDTGGKIATEEWPPSPPPHVAWRVPVEQTVLASAGRGIRSIVLRPGRAYGHGGSFAGRLMAEARRDGVVRYIGDGLNHWSLIHIDDLVELYVLALGNAPAGTLLNAVVEPSLPVLEIVEAASWAGGANGKTASITLAEAQQTMGAAADALALDQRISGAKAKALLGWTPSAPTLFEDWARSTG